MLMFLDGAGWHRAKRLVIPENMRLEGLRPYSTQLNPMEHLWEELREKWFANEVFDSLDSVEDRLVEALVALEGNQNLVASNTGFDWIINCQLTANYYELPSLPGQPVPAAALYRRLLPVLAVAPLPLGYGTGCGSSQHLADQPHEDRGPHPGNQSPHLGAPSLGISLPRPAVPGVAKPAG